MTVDEIVLDTSAAVDALLDRPAPPRLLDRLAQADLHSPHLVDIELLSVLRRLLHGKEISLHQALDAADRVVREREHQVDREETESRSRIDGPLHGGPARLCFLCSRPRGVGSAHLLGAG